MRLRVYIAGPYSNPDPLVNTRRAIEAAMQLVDAGFAPFIPHLTHFMNELHPRPYETWMTLDFEWLRACHCLVRLPGESPGADREVALARQLGMEVFESVDVLINKAAGPVGDPTAGSPGRD